MGIHFSEKRWNKVKRAYRKWWAGELKRPVSGVILLDRAPGRDQPPAPLLSQATCHDFSWTADEIIDRMDYELSRQTYLGDAFPYVNLDCFGPGVVAAFLGARLDNATGAVWFIPETEKPITEIHFTYDPENPWLLRIKDICRAAVKRWGNRVVVAMPDLGGALDILQTFRPGEKLLLDLYDHPDEVHRLVREIHQLWHLYYSEISEILQQQDMGYSDWSGIYSETPFYTLQCDISYMISPEMFHTFALPELKASAARLDRSVYHLDGPGALGHLDSILEMEDLSCVQWVPGEGNPPEGAWPEVYRKIAASGKLIQSMGSPFEDLLKIVMQTKTPGRIQHSHIILEKGDVKSPVIEEGRVLVPSSLIILVRIFYSLYKPFMTLLRGVLFIRKRLEK